MRWQQHTIVKNIINKILDRKKTPKQISSPMKDHYNAKKEPPDCAFLKMLRIRTC